MFFDGAVSTRALLFIVATLTDYDVNVYNQRLCPRLEKVVELDSLRAGIPIPCRIGLLGLSNCLILK